MGVPSWGEITTFLVAMAGGIGWWDRRRGRVAELEAEVTKLTADLETATTEAAKAQRSHEDALASKNAEIIEWRRQVERRDDRITALEDRLYTGGGRP